MFIQAEVQGAFQLKSDTVAISLNEARAEESLLIARSVAGDSEAFAALIERHRRLLYRAVYRITKHHEDAEDVVQETILKAYKHLHHFEQRSQFKSWLVRIGMNQALMCLRSKRRCVISSGYSSDCSEEWCQLEAAEECPSLEELILWGELRHNLQRSILRLPERLRMVASLRIMEDRTVSQMAATLGISQSAVKSRLLRARKRLAQLLLKQNKTAGIQHL